MAKIKLAQRNSMHLVSGRKSTDKFPLFPSILSSLLSSVRGLERVEKGINKVVKIRLQVGMLSSKGGRHLG